MKKDTRAVVIEERRTFTPSLLKKLRLQLDDWFNYLRM